MDDHYRQPAQDEDRAVFHDGHFMRGEPQHKEWGQQDGIQQSVWQQEAVKKEINEGDACEQLELPALDRGLWRSDRGI
jgi:hypothetical protein